MELPRWVGSCMVSLNTPDSLSMLRCSPLVCAPPVRDFQIPLRGVAASSRHLPAPHLDEDELEKADDMEAILFP